MYRCAALFLVIAVALPALSLAETAPAAPKQPACFLTSEKDPSGTKTFQIAAETKKEIQAYLTDRVMCPSACFDVAVTMEFKKDSIVATIAATNMCRFGVIPSKAEAEHNNRGCVNSQIKPAFTLKLIGSSAKAQPTKTRCDVATVQAALADATPKANKGVELRSIAQNAVTSADLSIPENRDKFRNILQAFGVSSEEAKDVVENRPDDAKALMQAFAAGDKDQIQEAAREAGVSLNESTVNDFVSLQPEDQVKKFADLYTPEQLRFMSSESFPVQTPQQLPGGKYGEMFNKLEKEYGLPPGYLAGVAKVESAGNPTACARTSSACGMFQHINSTWRVDSARINGGVPLDPSLRFDPEISARVTAATSAYYQDRYGSLMLQSGMEPKAANYSLHNLGESGGQRFMRAYAANPNTPVYAVLSAVEIRNNPSLYGNGSITLAQAEQNMLKKMSGSSNFDGVPAGSAFAALFNTRGSNPYMARQVSSPFAQVNPANAYLSPATIGTPAGGVTPAQSNVTNPSGSISSIAGGTSPVPVSQPLIKPSMNFLVQPRSVSKGAPVTLAWATVGMSTEMPCQLFAGASFLAQGNEGSRKFDTTSVTASSSVQFTLQCFAQSGTKLQATSSAFVK